MNEIMVNHDIVLVQEHWLYQSHLSKLKLLGDGVSSTAKSSMDEAAFRRGRPYGGCAIVWKPRLQFNISAINCVNSRLCAVQIKVDDKCTILLFNTYMPCDTLREDDSYYQFVDVLNEIEQHIYKCNPSHVIFGGDLNTDLSRDSPQTRVLKMHMETFNMTACIDLQLADVPYTFICPATSNTSRIDHFMVTDNLVRTVSKCNIIDNPLYSDHVPVSLELDISTDYLCQSSNDNLMTAKPAWHKATEEQIINYKHVCEQKLRDITFDSNALFCNDVFCSVHSSQINELYNNVIAATLDAASVIPTSVSSPSKVIPGWNQYVEQYKQDSLYWHQCWKDQGKPHNGPVADQMRLSRARYHRAVRNVKRQSDEIKMEKMAEAMSKNNYRDLFSEAKRMKGRSNINVPCVDECMDDETIAEMFGSKYERLYNSVPYDVNEMNDIKVTLDLMLEKESCKYSVSVENVIDAISHLKRGKGSGSEELYSDHLINAPHLLYVMLSILFNAMLVHGFSPDSMILGTMVPIPKCKYKELDKSDNYRSIALSSIIGKTLDWVILLKEKNSLNSSDLQFGFKEGSSTTQCTYVLLETVNYFNYHGSNVYALLLDATKAFDRVHYCKLFKELIKRKLAPAITRMLMYMYTSQKLQVKWGNAMSDEFSVMNGVKQGGVLSPILFAVYMDGLLMRLKKAGIGCNVGNWFVGCLAFADDLTLLAPSLSALKKLVSICEAYADEYHVQFNGLKSKFLIFKGRGCKHATAQIIVNGSTLNNVKEADHLGHAIHVEDSDSLVSAAIRDLWKSFNIFMADFGHIHSFIKCKLFKQYCCTFYGAPLFLMNGKGVQQLCIAWRKALRVVWRISNMTHKYIVAMLSECMPLEMSLNRRFIKFLTVCIEGKSSITKGIVRMSAFNPFSITCNNLSELVHRYKFYSGFDISAFKVEWNKSMNEEMIANVKVLSEMINVRDGFNFCEGLSNEEVVCIIDSICVH